MNQIINSKLTRITPLLFAVIIISCNHKENVIPHTSDSTGILNIMENYFKVANTKVDGAFIFESNVTNNDPTLTNTALAGGVFYDKGGNVQNGNGKVSIGAYQLKPGNSGTYGFNEVLPQNGLYGTNVSFVLQFPNNNSSSGGLGSAAAGENNIVNGTIYSPLPITVTNIPPRTAVHLTPNTNTTLTWNTDSQNPNGVVVIAEYLPTRYMNKPALSMGNTVLIEKAMNVPDNGKTSVPWSFFSQFPQGGHIILWIGRGNYTIASNGSYQYKIGGYTAAAVWDVLVPYQTIYATFAPANGYQAYTPPTSVHSLGGVANCTIVIHKDIAPDWTAPVLIGHINACIPKSTRIFSSSSGGSNWSTTIDKYGNIYTHWVGGSASQGITTVQLQGSYNIYD